MKYPLDIRKANRANLNFSQSSNYGQDCPEYLQANLAIVPSKYADDFKRFCELNAAACPVLYVSKPGEYAAPLLAEDSDVRTDVSAYKVFKNGSLEGSTKDLLKFDWTDMVTFYLGCSFTFESRLQENGIRLQNNEEGKNVSMYTTNLICQSSGPFSCHMVVSMRPVSELLLDVVISACSDCDYCHGSPIHIGNGKEIGIESYEMVNFGDASSFEEGDVPVFWACGVTSALAVSGAKLPLSFSHKPGCMYIADIKADQCSELFNSPRYPPAKTICLRRQTQTYSVLSETVIQKINKLEEEVAKDPGNRGIRNLLVADDLLKATLSLSQSAKSVCIATGFACFEDDPKIENDGIAGAIAIARAMQAISVSVTLLVDKESSPIFHQIMEWCHSNGLLKHEVPVIFMDHSVTSEELIVDTLTGEPRYSHLIAIERPGRNKDGKYCTMNNRDVSKSCDLIDNIFIEASSRDDIVTIGIGDGGNEIGMGKVLDLVKEHVANGADIACVVATDYLITCGVSNWGGYSLAAALYSVVNCPVHERYRRRGIGLPQHVEQENFVTTKEQEMQLLKFLISLGIRDGITKKTTMTVDNLSFEQHHYKKLDDIHAICAK